MQFVLSAIIRDHFIFENPVVLDRTREYIINQCLDFRLHEDSRTVYKFFLDGFSVKANKYLLVSIFLVIVIIIVLVISGRFNTEPDSVTGQTDSKVKIRKFKMPREFVFRDGKPRSWQNEEGNPRAEAYNDELPRGIAFDTPVDIHKAYVGKRIAANEKLYSLFRPAISSADFINAIGIKPTDEIADIGSGTGAFVVGLLEHEVPFKTIYAVDIDEKVLGFLDFILETANYKNRGKVRTVLSTPTDVRLPPKSIDLALIINVGCFETANEETLQCMSTIKNALRPLGKVYLISEKSKLDPDNIEMYTQTLQASDLRVIRKEILDFQDWGYYMVVAEKQN